MAHELTIRRSGQIEMAYVTGTNPWHGLGQEFAPGAPLEEITLKAGMEWEVLSAPAQYQFNGETYEIKDSRILHRSDTGHALGQVSGSYKIVQPKETITFFADLIEGLGLKMATAGTLFNGRKFWATGYIGEDSVVDNRDLVKSYLLLSSSADGSMATTARFVSTCVVCNNTLRIANEENAKALVKVVHSTKFDATKTKQLLGVAPKTFEKFMGDIRKLAQAPVNEEQAFAMTEELLRKEDTEDLGRVGDRIIALFNGEAMGAELEGRQGTAWAWLNAVTQFVDHDRKGKTNSHKLNSMLFGRGEGIKDRAYAIAMEEVA